MGGRAVHSVTPSEEDEKYGKPHFMQRPVAALVNGGGIPPEI
jgi:hypothetical protein